MCLQHILCQKQNLFVIKSVLSLCLFCIDIPYLIGILINGRFVCFGSTPYLKNKYGDGYKITVKKGDKFIGNMDEVILKVSNKAIRALNASENYDTFQVKFNIVIVI